MTKKKKLIIIGIIVALLLVAGGIKTSTTGQILSYPHKEVSNMQDPSQFNVP